MITAEAIIEEIKGTHRHILRLCQNVPEEELAAPILANGWSVKDTVAHIAAWDWRCAALLSESYDTDTPLKAHPDVDALNLEIYEERRNWSWEEVESDFWGAHRALLEAIQKLPPERLSDAVVQESIAEETCEHYEQHLPELEEWHRQITGSRVASGRSR